MAPVDLEEKHLQRDNLKDIDLRHKIKFQSMRSPKGAKHYLAIVIVKDGFLTIRNQRKQLSCNDNTWSLGNENCRLEYQPTKKSETLEMHERDVGGWCPTGRQLEILSRELQGGRTTLGINPDIKNKGWLYKDPAKSWKINTWQGSHAARLTR